MKDTYVFDLDGTLSDGRHRLHLLPKKEDAHRTEAWDAFNLAADKDSPFLDNIELLRTLFDAGKRIIILTGRCDVAEKLTEDWLWRFGVTHHKLIMRPASDHRKDIAFKEEKLKEIGLHRIIACFDDLEHVAEHIRSLGVTCHLVTKYQDARVDTTNHIRYPAFKTEADNLWDTESGHAHNMGYNQAIADTMELNK